MLKSAGWLPYAHAMFKLLTGGNRNLLSVALMTNDNIISNNLFNSTVTVGEDTYVATLLRYAAIGFKSFLLPP